MTPSGMEPEIKHGMKLKIIKKKTEKAVRQFMEAPRFKQDQ